MRDSLLIVVHEVDVYMHQNTAQVRLCYKFVSFGYVIREYLLQWLRNHIDILPIRIWSNADMRDSLLIMVHEVEVYMHQNTAPVRRCYKIISFGYVLHEYLLQWLRKVRIHIDILSICILSNTRMRDSLLIVVHEVDVYMHQNTAPVRLCYKFVSFGYVFHEYLLLWLRNHIDILPMRIYSNADICDCLLIVVHGVDVYMHQNTFHQGHFLCHCCRVW